MEASFVESKIETLVQADFEIASEIAGARDLFPHSDGSDEIESAWVHLDVHVALRRQLRCGLLQLRIAVEFYTNDFWRDFHSYKAKGVVFVRDPKEEAYGTVAVFKDLYGNLWDLLELKKSTG